MFRLDTKRAKEDALGVHLRFGDTEANGNVEFYTKNIGHIQGLTGVQKVRFCYHSKDDQEMLLVKLKEVFPEAEFVNSGPIMETMACLTEGRMMVTSGSSLSYMFAHLCKECVVFFTQPKELMPVNTLYKEELLLFIQQS
ncbi:hypothetical protein BGZ73_000086 [Actinomortierella ambigua]|nr:hypothetical protein BGZ73_000086 [Actinomortierella ambigua]